MKKLVYIMVLALTVGALQSCNNQKQADTSAEDSKADSLQRIIDQRDSEINDMMSTINDVQEGLRLISEAENRVTIAKGGEGADKAQAIKEDMKFIAEQMQKNRDLIAKLRQKMRESSIKTDEFANQIDNLTRQLDTKESEISALKKELEKKDVLIAELDEKVENLNSNVEELTDENKQQSVTISKQDQQLNAAWYVFGTKKELKDQHILEDGKVLQANFNQSYFTKLDIRIDKEIKLYSKSATLMTSHPAGSYELVQDASKQYTLKVTNPDKFWSTSKYLVILVK